MRMLMLLLLTILLASCGASGVVDACKPWRPIRVAAADQITAPTARDILAHNLTGRKLCGW